MKYDNELNKMYKEIEGLIEETRRKIHKTVNTEMVLLYWMVGKTIMGLQKGKERAQYGKKLLEDLSMMLTNKYGKGFSYRNIRQMRQFYVCFPIWQTMSAKLTRFKKFYIYYQKVATLSQELTWSHYAELIKIKNKQERDFYMNESVNSNWDVRTLQRQRKSLLYERLLISSDKDKKELLPIKGQVIESSSDLIKDPYILEFLNMESTNYKEKDLEMNIINHLKEFMLELGRGFMYVGNQVRIKIENEEFYVDLVFYNRILNCHVLIDLKVGKITHRDIGQMESYVNYYDKYIKKEKEKNTIGIILGTTKNKVAVKLTTRDNSEIYASIYKLHLPSKEELENFMESEKIKYNVDELTCE